MNMYIGNRIYTNVIMFSQYKELAKEHQWPLPEFQFEIKPNALGYINEKKKFILLDFSPVAYAQIKENGIPEDNLETVYTHDVKDKVKVDFYFNYQVMYSEPWLHHLLREIPKEEIVFQDENLIVINRQGFRIMIDQRGGVTMQKEIAEYEIEVETTTATKIYMTLKNMNSHFAFPWQIKIIAPVFKGVDMVSFLLATRNIHIERNVFEGNMSMVMSGELFV